jgi:hypothetical protein
MSYAYKFTDTHVRKHPELLAIAIEYVKAYEGEFEPMVEAKHAILTGGTLNVAQTRKVLNTLRQDFDPDAASLQVEAKSVLEELSSEYQAEVRRSQFRVVPEKPKERPSSVTTKVTLNVPYVMPRPRQGAIHIATSAECRWKLPDHWRQRHLPEHLREVRTPELWVYYLCGGYTYNRPILLTEDEVPGAMAMDRRHCVKCFPT